MSHLANKTNGVHFNWFSTADWKTASGGSKEVRSGGATSSTLNYQNYPQYSDKESVRDTFFINDDTLGSVTGKKDNIFVQGYSFLNIPDVSGSDTFDLNFRLRTDDGFEVWLDIGNGFETVVKNRTDHAPRYDYGSITVPDNTTIPIKVEWWEWRGGAVLDVQWSETSGGTSYTSIKNEYLTLNPIFMSDPPTSAVQNSPYSYSVEARNIHQNSLDQTLTAEVLPSWLLFNSLSGQLVGTPTNSDVGDHSVVLKITDSGGLTSEQSFTVVVNDINDAPIFNSVAVTSVDQDNNYYYVATASDIDMGDVLTLSTEVLPSWLVFDSLTGKLSGTPTNSDVGDHLVVLEVTDSGGLTAEQSFTVTVDNVNGTPIFRPNIRSKVGENLIIDFFVSDTFWGSNAKITDFQLSLKIGDSRSEFDLEKVMFNAKFLGDSVYDDSTGIISLGSVTTTNFSSNSEPLFSVYGQKKSGLDNLTILESDVIINDITFINASSRLSSKGGVVDGSVTSRKGNGIEDAIITGFSMAGNQILSAVTDSNGKFTIDIEEDIVFKIQKNFVDDNAITVRDALDALKLSIGQEKSDGTVHPFDYVAADFNRDGEVSVWDALHILRHSINMSAPETSWVFLRDDTDLNSLSRHSVTYDEELAINFSEMQSGLNLVGILIGDVNSTV